VEGCALDAGGADAAVGACSSFGYGIYREKCEKQQQQRQQQHHLSRAVARWDSEAANTRNTDSGKG
jgi:hypothetical protein